MIEDSIELITVDRIVNKNLELLDSQEAQLRKTLMVIEKARAMFKTHVSEPNGLKRKTRKKVGRPRGKSTTKTKKVALPKHRTKGRAGTHLNNIVSILKKQSSPIATGEVIKTMFESQKKVKDLKLFRQRIYPVLSKAYKSGVVKKKGGKVQLPA